MKGKTVDAVIVVSTGVLWVMLLLAVIAPWLPSRGRFVLLSIAGALFIALVVWAPEALTGWLAFLQAQLWVAFLLVATFVIGIFANKD